MGRSIAPGVMPSGTMDFPRPGRSCTDNPFSMPNNLLVKHPVDGRVAIVYGTGDEGDDANFPTFERPNTIQVSTDDTLTSWITYPDTSGLFPPPTGERFVVACAMHVLGGNKILILINDSPDIQARIFDWDTGLITLAASFPYGGVGPGSHSRSAADIIPIELPDGRIYCGGFFYDDGSHVTAGMNIMYHPDSDTWTMLAVQNGNHDGAAALLSDGNILYIGGGNAFLNNKIEVYDVGADTWSTVQNSLLTNREGFAFQQIGVDTFLLIGGRDISNVALSSCEKFVYTGTSMGVSTGTLTAAGSLLIPRVGSMPSVLFPDGLHAAVFGGYGSDGGCLASIEVYDIVGDSWSLDVPVLSHARVFFGGVLISTSPMKFWMPGGEEFDHLGTYDRMVQIADVYQDAAHNHVWRNDTPGDIVTAADAASGSNEADGDVSVASTQVSTRNTTPAGTWSSVPAFADFMRSLFVEHGIGSLAPRKWGIVNNGTVWKFEGGSWTQITAVTLPVPPTYPNVVHGIDGDVYIGTADAGGGVAQVFHSTNDGATWTQIGDLGLGPLANLVALWVNAANDIFTTDGFTLFHWNGSTWSSVKTARTGDFTEAFAAIWGDGTNVYLAGSYQHQDHGIWYSNDNGSTWTEQSPGLTQADINTVYAAGGWVYAAGEAWALYSAHTFTDDWSLDDTADFPYDPTFTSPVSAWRGVWVDAAGDAWVAGGHAHNVSIDDIPPFTIVNPEVYTSQPAPAPPSGIDNAFANSTRTIRVHFVAAVPIDGNSRRDKDVLNPASWTVERLDTEENLTITSITKLTVDDVIYYDVGVLEALPNDKVSLTITYVDESNVH